MRLHLVVPGLLWPSEQARGFADGLALPALTRLLGRGQCDRGAPATPERAWRRLFGLDAAAAADGALRRLGEEDGLRVTDSMMCADPSHLHFTRDHLLLIDPAELAITPDESAALIDCLNRELADLGQFEACAPTRWYLYPRQAPTSRFAALGDVTSRPVAHFLPEGEDAARWQRAMNEIQVLLHNHPVNAARESAGQRLINNVWFWGAGTLPPSLQSPAPHLVMTSPFTIGLARASAVEPAHAHQFDALPAGDTLVSLDALLQPSRYLDLERWRAALETLEASWFAPALDALQRRRLSRLTLTVPDERGSLTIDFPAHRLLQFWRKDESLEAFTLRQRP